MYLVDVLTAGPYNIAFASGVLVALVLAHRAARRANLPPLAWAVLLAASLAGGIVGSKTLFLDFQPIAAGEKTNLGGLLVGIATLVIASRALRLGAWRSLDTVTVPTLAAMAIGRVGCFFAGCCAGTATTSPFAVRDADGHAVHPVQLYEAAADVLLIVLLGRWARERSPGTRFLLAFLGYAGIRFSTEFVREGREIHLGLNLVQWSLIAIALLLAIIMSMRSMLATRSRAHGSAAVSSGRPPSGRVGAVLVIATLITASMLLGSWFVPLEQVALLVLAGGVAATGLAIVFESFMPAVRLRAIPLALVPRLSAMMMMQEPVVEERPRREVIVGGRMAHSAWDQAIGQAYGTDCNGGEVSTPTRADRDATIGEVSVGVRTQHDSSRRTWEGRFIGARDGLGDIEPGPVGFAPRSNTPWAVGAAVTNEYAKASTRIEVLAGNVNRTDAPPTNDPTLLARLRVGDANGWFTQFNYADTRFSPIHRDFSHFGVGWNKGRDGPSVVIGAGAGFVLGFNAPVGDFALDLTFRELDAASSGGGSAQVFELGMRRTLRRR